MANRSVRSMSPSVVVRPATDRDLDAIVDLAVQTHDHHVAGDPHAFEPVRDLDEKRTHFAQWLRDGSTVVLVAVAADRAVGYAVVLEGATPSVPGLRPRRIARVEDLGVDQAHRREGIGRRLMGEVLALARVRGLDAIELNVYEFNAAAIALYESLGYEATSRRMRLVVPGDT